MTVLSGVPARHTSPEHPFPARPRSPAEAAPFQSSYTITTCRHPTHPACPSVPGHTTLTHPTYTITTYAACDPTRAPSHPPPTLSNPFRRPRRGPGAGAREKDGEKKERKAKEKKGLDRVRGRRRARIRPLKPACGDGISFEGFAGCSCGGLGLCGASGRHL